MAQPTDVSRAQIRPALERVLASSEFAGSERSRALLKYLVEEHLAGRADRLKGYTIAVDVFGRDDSFDPGSDSIVRVQAGALRRSLEHYYLTEGRSDPVVISVPIGSYAPLFKSNPNAAGARAASSGMGGSWQLAAVNARAAVLGFGALSVLLAASVMMLGWSETGFDRSRSRPHGGHERPAAGRIGPKIAVLRFFNSNQGREHAYFADGITQQIAQDLARFHDLIVLTVDATTEIRGSASHVKRLAGTLGVDYLLDGTVLRSALATRVTARLHERRTGTLIWTDDFERKLTADRLLEDMAHVSGLIVSRIGLANGVINRRETAVHLYHDNTRANAKPPGPRECVLEYYAYERGDMRHTHASVRRCLKRTVASHPAYAIAWAYLAGMYIEQMNAGLDGGAKDDVLLTKAGAAAERAVQLDPTQARMHKHLAMVRLHQGRVDQAKRRLMRAVALNPNDADVLAATSVVFVFTGDLDFGEPLIRKAIRMNPGFPPWYNLPLAVFHYQRKEYGKALERARAYSRENNLLSFVLMIAAAGQLGRPDQASETIRKLRSEFPDFGQDPRALLKRWRLGEELIDRYMEGLRKAGLKIAPKGTAPRS